MLLLTPVIARISHDRCQWLALRVWWHALAFVTQEITWHQAYVARLCIHCYEKNDVKPLSLVIKFDPSYTQMNHSTCTITLCQCSLHGKDPEQIITVHQVSLNRTWCQVTEWPPLLCVCVCVWNECLLRNGDCNLVKISRNEMTYHATNTYANICNWQMHGWICTQKTECNTTAI